MSFFMLLSVLYVKTVLDFLVSSWKVSYRQECGVMKSFFYFFPLTKRSRAGKIYSAFHCFAYPSNFKKADGSIAEMCIYWNFSLMKEAHSKNDPNVHIVWNIFQFEWGTTQPFFSNVQNVGLWQMDQHFLGTPPGIADWGFAQPSPVMLFFICHDRLGFS